MLENRYRYGFSWWDYFYQTLWISKLKKVRKCKANSFFRNSIHDKGISKLKEETDMVEIIRSVRLLKVLTKILLSKNQINLLAFENSSLLDKNDGYKFWENSEIFNNQNGIKAKSYQVAPSHPKTLTNQNAYDKESKELQIELTHEDLLSYLSKEQNYRFKESINKLVTEFSNQENTVQN